MKSYTVVYRAAPRARVEHWLTIVSVPDEVGQAGVTEALQASRMWQRWHARLGIGASLTVRPARGTDNASDVIAWAELVPAARTITVRVPGAVHAAASRIAQARGQALTGFVEASIRDAVRAHGVELVEPPAPATSAALFEDVALPGIEP